MAENAYIILKEGPKQFKNPEGRGCSYQLAQFVRGSQLHYFVVLWDEDTDHRLLQRILQLFIRIGPTNLARYQVVGERKGLVTAVLSCNPDYLAYYSAQVAKYVESGPDGDSWGGRAVLWDEVGRLAHPELSATAICTLHEALKQCGRLNAENGAQNAV